MLLLARIYIHMLSLELDLVVDKRYQALVLPGRATEVTTGR